MKNREEEILAQKIWRFKKMLHLKEIIVYDDIHSFRGKIENIPKENIDRFGIVLFFSRISSPILIDYIEGGVSNSIRKDIKGNRILRYPNLCKFYKNNFLQSSHLSEIITSISVDFISIRLKQDLEEERIQLKNEFIGDEESHFKSKRYIADMDNDQKIEFAKRVRVWGEKALLHFLENIK